eukprot:scaffold19780_cov17-Tisochrysis_lutea.AAC.4
MQACEASISPFDSPGLPAMSEVITLAHGDRMLKMQVLEKPKNGELRNNNFVGKGEDGKCCRTVLFTQEAII